MIMLMKTLPSRGEFFSTNNVLDDVYLSSTEELHSGSNEIGDEDTHFPTKFGVPSSDDIFNEDDDGHSK